MNFYRPVYKQMFYTYNNKYATGWWYDLKDINIKKLFDEEFGNNKIKSYFYGIGLNQIYFQEFNFYEFQYDYSIDLEQCINWIKEYSIGAIDKDRYKTLISRDFKNI